MRRLHLCRIPAELRCQIHIMLCEHPPPVCTRPCNTPVFAGNTPADRFHAAPFSQKKKKIPDRSGKATLPAERVTAATLNIVFPKINDNSVFVYSPSRRCFIFLPRYLFALYLLRSFNCDRANFDSKCSGASRTVSHIIRMAMNPKRNS